MTSWTTSAFFAGLLLLAIWAMTVGSSEISFAQVGGALLDPGSGREDLVVRTIRLPRVLAAVLVGASLAVAGAICQAVTGNPLAEPGLLGINAGAAFAVVLAMSVFGVTAAHALLWVAIAGAAGAALTVYSLGSVGRSGPAPLKLIIAGVVVTTFLGAVAMSILILDAQTLDTVRLWTAGSLVGRQMRQVLTVAPYMVPALLVSLKLGRQFTTLGLGQDVARGLGQDAARWRGIAAVLVIGLAGGSVAIAGPLGFVGLVVPHVARMLVGTDYRKILPLCVVGGATLTLIADTVPRAWFGRDVPIGVTLALTGAPFFIWLARRHGQVRA